MLERPDNLIGSYRNNVNVRVPSHFYIEKLVSWDGVENGLPTY